MSERTATGRLRRLLALVPYVLAHQGVALSQAASRFGISEAELIDDLNLLFVCGLPGYSHMELIDVSYESGEIFIRNAEVISAPMRLHRDEALSLMIGLQLIEHLAAAEDQEALSDLRAKLLAGASEALENASDRVAVVADEENQVGATVAEALSRQRRLLIQYFVPSRDEVTEREVDPISIATIEGIRYLRAWCRQAEALRHFRLDRIDTAKIIDRPASVPVKVDESLDSAFVPPASAETVRLRLTRGGRWLIEFLNATLLTEHDGGVEVSVAIGDVDRILTLIRQMGDSAEVIEPAHLRDAARDSARATLTLYN